MNLRYCTDDDAKRKGEREGEGEIEKGRKSVDDGTGGQNQNEFQTRTIYLSRAHEKLTS